MHTALPSTITVLHETDHTIYMPEEAAKREEEHQKDLKAARADAEFAAKEIKDGFPLLNAHALVGLWSALESAVEDALVGTLMNEKELLKSEAFAKLRIPLAEYDVLEQDERMRLLIQELRRGHPLEQTQGVDGMERLLGYMNLSGQVDPEVKKTMWEMQNVRNVIVHRGSIVDRRLMKNCPWLPFKLGEPLTVSYKDLHRYDMALHEYLFEIIRRLGLKYNVEIDDTIKNFSRFRERHSSTTH